MYSAVLEKLASRSVCAPDLPIIRGDQTLTASELLSWVEELAVILKQTGERVIASQIGNSAAWVALDLACLLAGRIHLPLPPFFSPAQIKHALDDAGAQILFTDHPVANGIALGEFGIWKTQLNKKPQCSINTAKLTYTSGSTAAPKAVMLSRYAMETVAGSLARAVNLGHEDRHMILMPLGVLLENIGGIYAPILAGASIILRPLSELGATGAGGIDGRRILDQLTLSAATTAITTPLILMAMISALEAGAATPPKLRFIAVGGAPLAPRILVKAHAVGLPVYEGYGLSECSSVLTVNTPAAHRVGSVGKPLEHASIRIAEDGEILASGVLFDGYLHTQTQPHKTSWFPTGDLGHIDNDGFLWLTGRKKNVFATAGGRNVSPEWVERELCAEPGIIQAAVYGEARPRNCAVLVCEDTPDKAIESGIERINEGLPDYARVAHWIRATEPFNVANQQLTGTGRPRRSQIELAYGEAIHRFYTSTEIHLERNIHEPV